MAEFDQASLSAANERPAMAGAPVSVLLLARNDAAHVAEVITVWGLLLEEELARPFEIILVDDGSHDGTADRAASLSARFLTLNILRHDQPRGLGAALRTGLAAAGHPLLVTAIANKQFQPAELKRLLEVIDQVDLVTGYRVGFPVPWWLSAVHGLYRLALRLGFGIPLDPLPSWLGWQAQLRHSLCKWLFGVRLHDPECVFRLFRRQLFQRLPIQSDGGFAQVEVLAKANFLGCWMAEVPVTYLPAQYQPETWKRAEVLALFRHPDFGPWLGARG